MENVARPCVRDRRSVAYPNIAANGTRELTMWVPATRLHRFDLAAPAVQIADDVAHELLWHDHLDAHDRLQQHCGTSARGCPERHGAGDLERLL